MKINNSELSIFVENEGNNYYRYELQEKENNRIPLGSFKDRPTKLGVRSNPYKTLKQKIPDYILPSVYNEINIDTYIQGVLRELEIELEIQEDNQPKEYETEYLKYPVQGYIFEDNTYWKISYRNGNLIKENEILRGKITNFLRIADYSKDTTNNFEITILDMNEERNKKTEYHFTGTKGKIIKNIINNDLGWSETYVRDFIYKLAYTHSNDNTKMGVVGGYESWDNIKIMPKDKLRDISELTNYFKNKLTKKHLEVIKSTIFIPFHWILRQDKNYMGRGIIKFVVIHGVPAAFKNGIVNIVRNMFDFHTTIPIDEGGTPNTYASLRNSINDNIGFVLCDESDNAFIDENKKFRSQTDNSVENLLKMVFQAGMPSVSEETGKNLEQEFRGTPIFIWNDDFKKTKALEDRCIVLCFEEQFNLKYEDLFDIEKFKEDLLYFGAVFASCLKEHWKGELDKIREYEEIINTVFKYMKEDYNIDTDFLIKTKIKEENKFVDIFDIFYNRMHNKLHKIYNLEHYIDGDKINNKVFDKMEVNFIKHIGKKELYVNQNRFIDYIRYHVAKDGGLLIEQIEEIFDLGETVKKGNVNCYKININTFMQNINKHSDDEEKTIKKETQSRIL